MLAGREMGRDPRGCLGSGQGCLHLAGGDGRVGFFLGRGVRTSAAARTRCSYRFAVNGEACLLIVRTFGSAVEAHLLRWDLPGWRETRCRPVSQVLRRYHSVRTRLSAAQSK